MWWPQPKQASSATMAIVYITVGALMDVWTTIYYIYLRRNGAESDTAFLWVYGFFATGIVLMLIGFALGYIGRSAKQAEVAAPAPPVAGATVAGTQPMVAAMPVSPAPPMPAPSVTTAVPR